MTRSQRLMAWMRGHAIVTDTLGAAFILFMTTGINYTVQYNPGLLFNPSPAAQMIWSALLIAPMAFRRRFPQSSALAYAVLAVLQLVFGPSMQVSDLLSMVMLYSVIAYGGPRNTRKFIALATGVGLFAVCVIGWAMTVGAAFGTGADSRDGIATASPYHVVYEGKPLPRDGIDMLLQWLAFGTAAIAICLASTIVLAFWQRARLLTIRMMRERNIAIAEREDEERNIAALAERARIARDMHDVVAHTLSIIIVQSDGGRYAGTHDPAVARNTMETIRRESERALHDMNRLLGVFGGSPNAGYTDIDALVEQARAVASDAAITRRISGTPDPGRLGSEAGAAVYHVVQEALTNIRKYAGPRVHVTIDETWSDDGLRIVVDDDGRGASANADGHKPGYGLLGMRERIETVGGHVSSGPRIGGGFSVAAEVPFTAPAAESKTTSGIHNANKTDVGQADPGIAIATISPESEHAATNATNETTVAEPAARSAPSPKPPKMPSLKTLRDRLRSKPIAQADGPHGGSFNWVERLSRWTQRHYVAADTLTTLFLIFMFGLFPGQYGATGNGTSPVVPLLLFLEMLPLCVRRRFPEGAALVVACLSSMQLLLFGDVELPNVVSSLCALYSAVLYGGRHAWRWTGLAALFNALLFGGSVTVSQLGYPSTASALFRHRTVNQGDTLPTFTSAAFLGALYALLLFMTCVGVMAMALWTRSNDSNAMVLQAREEALLAQEAKQRVLAANMERDRISANIQAEVTATLNSVITQAADGVRMLDEAESHGLEPTPEAISAAFEAIGRQGRTALKRMRELLGVLRETGFSDDGHADDRHRPLLRPAASLDEQMRDSGLRPENKTGMESAAG